MVTAVSVFPDAVLLRTCQHFWTIPSQVVNPALILNVHPLLRTKPKTNSVFLRPFRMRCLLYKRLTRKWGQIALSKYRQRDKYDGVSRQLTATGKEHCRLRTKR